MSHPIPSGNHITRKEGILPLGKHPLFDFGFYTADTIGIVSALNLVIVLICSMTS